MMAEVTVSWLRKWRLAAAWVAVIVVASVVVTVTGADQAVASAL